MEPMGDAPGPGEPSSAAAQTVPPAQQEPEETSLDEAQIIHLIRALLPSSSGGAQQPGDAESREQAGTLLWDLSVIHAVAEVMVNAGMIYQVVEALLTAELIKCQQQAPLQEFPDGCAPGSGGGWVPPRPNTPIPVLTTPADGKHGAAGASAGAGATAAPCAPEQQPQAGEGAPLPSDPSRPVEVALGLLANLASHGDLAARLASRDHVGLVDLVCGAALHVLSSSSCLSELCRLASTALRKSGGGVWLERLGGMEAAERICWVATRTRDPVLHARALDLLVALVHTHFMATHAHLEEEEEHAHQGEGAHAANGGARSSGAVAPSPALSNGPASLCAWHLVQAGLLDLVRSVLQQAVQQVAPNRQGARAGASSAWAGFTPAPTAPPAGSVMMRRHPRGAQRTPFARDNQQQQQGQGQQRTRDAGGSRLGASRGARTTQGTPALPPTVPEGEVVAGGAEGTALPSERLPMSEASVDAALRAIEVLGALGGGEGSEGDGVAGGGAAGGIKEWEARDRAVHEALLADATLARHVVQMLHCDPGEQALDHSAVVALADNSLAHCNALLDCLGELPMGERGAWQRELVLYLLARTLRHLASNATTTTNVTASLSQRSLSSGGGGDGAGAGHGTPPPPPTTSGAKRQRVHPGDPQPSDAPNHHLAGHSNSHQEDAGGGGEGAGEQDPPPGEAGADSAPLLAPQPSFEPPPAAATTEVLQATSQELVDLGARVEGLDESCGVSGAHVQGYLRSMLRSVLVLLEPHAARTASGGRSMRTAVQRQCLALKEKLVVLTDAVTPGG